MMKRFCKLSAGSLVAIAFAAFASVDSASAQYQPECDWLKARAQEQADLGHKAAAYRLANQYNDCVKRYQKQNLAREREEQREALEMLSSDILMGVMTMRHPGYQPRGGKPAAQPRGTVGGPQVRPSGTSGTSRSGTTCSGGSCGGVMVSDIRLKHDIVQLARLDNGLGIYRYRYNGNDQVYVGVMAQEVETVIPQAVTRGPDGYMRVDYDRIGLKLKTWDSWLASAH